MRMEFLLSQRVLLISTSGPASGSIGASGAAVDRHGARATGWQPDARWAPGQKGMLTPGFWLLGNLRTETLLRCSLQPAICSCS